MGFSESARASASCRLFLVGLLSTFAGVTAAQEGAGAALVTLRGTIVDPGGRPLAGVGFAVGRAFEVTTDAALDAPLARSDEQGAFTLEVAARSVPSHNQQVAVLLAASGRAAMLLRAVGGMEPTTKLVDMGTIVVLPGVTLRGRVRDDAGRPLGGVRVMAHDLLRGRFEIAPGEAIEHFSATETRADGVFTLRGVPASGLRLSFGKAGYHEAVRSPVDRHTPLDVTLRTSGFTRGRVVDADGRPLRTWLRITYEAVPSEANWEVETDAEGRFRVSLALPTRYRFQVADVRSQVGEGRSAIFDGPQDDVVVTVRGGAFATVRALDDATGEALLDFEVSRGYGRLDAHPTHFEFHNGGLAAMRSVAGLVRVPIDAQASGPRAVRVAAAGFASAVIAMPGPDAGAKPIDVRFVRECVLEGRVVEAGTGRPVGGVSVYAAAPLPASIATSTGFPASAVRTDADGRFRVGGLPAGEYRVYAVAPRWAAPRSVTAVAKPGVVEPVTIEMPKRVRVAGKLETSVAPGARVRMDAPPNTFGMTPGELLFHRNDVRTVGVAADGTFVFDDVDPGSYRLGLLLPERYRSSGQRRIELGEVQVRAALERAFKPDLGVGVIDGKVSLGELGEHAPRLVVFAEPAVAVGRDPMAMLSVRPSADSVVGPDGAFRLELPAGEVHLVVFDMATGLQLFKTSDPLRVQAGASVTATLPLELRAVRVTLQAADAVRGPTVDALAIFAAAADQFAHIRYAMNMLGTSPGLDLPPGERTCWFLAAPGDYRLKVTSRSGFLAPGPSHNWSTLAETRIEVRDRDLAVELPLAPLPSSAELAGDR